MKRVLLYFGSKGYEQCKLRLYESAKGYFDEIHEYDERDIDREFYISNIKIFQHCRGWGYWLWKPYFILKTLEKLNDGDLCFYVDCTAVFISSPERLFEMCKNEQDILLFDNANYKNYNWTKADCFNLMGLNTDSYTMGAQVDAAMQLYKKSMDSIAFIKEWLFYCTDYHIISDDANITGDNLKGFKDHRHDQSVLSLLAIKHGVMLNASPRREYNASQPKIIDLKRDVQNEEAFYNN